MDGTVIIDEKNNNEFSLLRKVSRFIFFLFKSLFDFVVAFIGLVILFPLMVLIGVLIKLDSRGPILFKQKRTGKNGKVFNLYKFRSMVKENDVHDFNREDSTTRVGAFLRKTSLDELPQLINILFFQMSFIGPRPWIVDYYDNMNEVQRHRCDVLPGLTGLAQCSGRNSITIFDKINYDLYYVKNYSLWLDLKIIYLTVKTVLSKKGLEMGKSSIKNELDALKNQK